MTSTTRPTSPLSDPRGTLMNLVDKVLKFADERAAKRVDELRAQRPHDTPAHVIEQLERDFSQTVTMTGAGTGALAAAPGVGLPLALGASSGDLLAMLTAAGSHVLAVARVHDIPLGDINGDGLETRRTLLFGILLGGAGTKVIVNTASRTTNQWARAIAGSVSIQVLRELNRRLGGLLLRRVAPLLGLGAAVKFVPLGVGAVLGGSSNFYAAKQVIASARDAFGTPPVAWPTDTTASPTASRATSATTSTTATTSTEPSDVPDHDVPDHDLPNHDVPDNEPPTDPPIS